MIKRATDIYIKYVDLFNNQNELVPYLVVLNLDDNLSGINFTKDNGKSSFVNIDSAPPVYIIEIDSFAATTYLFLDAYNNLLN